MSLSASHNGPRPRLLLVEQELGLRLARVAALRADFEVEPEAGTDDLQRRARALRPKLVLLGGAGVELTQLLRLARGLRSGPAPPELGLLLLRAPKESPQALLERSGATGLLVGAPTPEQLLEWTLQVCAGRRALMVLQRSRRSRLKGLLGR